MEWCVLGTGVGGCIALHCIGARIGKTVSVGGLGTALEIGHVTAFWVCGFDCLTGRR